MRLFCSALYYNGSWLVALDITGNINYCCFLTVNLPQCKWCASCAEVYTTWTSNTLTLQSRALSPGSLPPTDWWVPSEHVMYLGSSCLPKEHVNNKKKTHTKHTFVFKNRSIPSLIAFTLQNDASMSMTFWLQNFQITMPSSLEQIRVSQLHSKYPHVNISHTVIHNPRQPLWQT
jgi:hypothetical protein